MNDTHNEGRCVLHICVFYSRYVANYVNFMKTKINDIKHYFVLTADLEGIVDDENIIRIDSRWRLLFDRKIRNIAKKASAVVVSPPQINVIEMLFLYPRSIIKKTYLHFWDNAFAISPPLPGASFFRAMRRKLFHWLRKRLFESCGGLIFLIEKEYDSYFSYWQIAKKHWVAAMPDDPSKTSGLTFGSVDFKRCSVLERTADNRLGVQVDHSAHNRYHEEAFEMIKKFDNIRVICPLTYGPTEYRDHIIKVGRSLFGDSFYPMVDHVPLEEYAQSIAKNVDVFVLLSREQQGMGNISLMLGLGKKVYMRPGTSMWDHFTGKGYILFSSEGLKTESYEEFSHIDPDVKKHNIETFYHYLDTCFDEWEMSWRRFFNDVLS